MAAEPSFWGIENNGVFRLGVLRLRLQGEWKTSLRAYMGAILAVGSLLYIGVPALLTLWIAMVIRWKIGTWQNRFLRLTSIPVSYLRETELTELAAADWAAGLWALAASARRARRTQFVSLLALILVFGFALWLSSYLRLFNSVRYQNPLIANQYAGILAAAGYFSFHGALARFSPHDAIDGLARRLKAVRVAAEHRNSPVVISGAIAGGCLFHFWLGLCAFLGILSLSFIFKDPIFESAVANPSFPLLLWLISMAIGYLAGMIYGGIIQGSSQADFKDVVRDIAFLLKASSEEVPIATDRE